jgi:hypothetical protein
VKLAPLQLLAILFVLFAAATANAACTSPTAAIGSMNWGGTAFQFCDGTTWQNFGSSQWSNGTAGAIYYNGGNVGIGTTSPASQLSISGGSGASDIQIGYILSTQRLMFNGTGAAVINRPAAGTLYFGETADTAGYQFRGSGNSYFQGNLGIGHISPLTNLHIKGNIGGYSSGATSAGSPLGASIYLGDSNFASASYYNSAPGLSAVFNATQGVASSLAFYTYSGAVNDRAERMRIDSLTGNVGIGTMAPTRHIDVRSVGSTGIHIAAGGTSQWAELTLQNSLAALNGKIWGVANEGTAGNLYFRTLNDDNSSNPIVRMALSRSGNVGIGTASPVHKLTVQDGSAWFKDTSNDNSLLIATSASTTGTTIGVRNNAYTIMKDLYIAANNTVFNGTGNVGIGTTSPAERLTVVQPGSALSVYSGASGNNEALHLFSGSSAAAYNSYLYGGTYDAGALAGSYAYLGGWDSRGGAAPLILQKSSGNVGIGTTGPSGALDILTSADWGTPTLRVRSSAGHPNIQIGSTISGSEQWAIIGCAASGCGPANALRFYSITDGADRMVIDTNGNVGIGTTSPGYKLDVAGDLKVGNISLLGPSGGILGKQGTNGGSNGNNFNFWWDGCIHVWVDFTDFSISCPSDKRIKKDIQALDAAHGLSAIVKLIPVSFRWKNPSAAQDTQYGLIAQEVQKILPDLVTNTKMSTKDTPDGLLKVNYEGIIPVLIRSVQELNSTNDNLRKDFEAYKTAHP